MLTVLGVQNTPGRSTAGGFALSELDRAAVHEVGCVLLCLEVATHQQIGRLATGASARMVPMVPSLLLG